MREQMCAVKVGREWSFRRQDDPQKGKGERHRQNSPSPPVRNMPRGLPDDLADVPLEELTEREREVLRLLAQGMPNKEIASHLVISERTAKFHVSSIMSKLGATNRTEAVTLAVQRGLITLHF